MKTTAYKYDNSIGGCLIYLTGTNGKTYDKIAIKQPYGYKVVENTNDSTFVQKCRRARAPTKNRYNA